MANEKFYQLYPAEFPEVFNAGVLAGRKVAVR